MQLFSTQLNQLDEQIKLLESQLIEAKGKAGWLKQQGIEATALVENLKLLIGKINDESAISTLKSAVNDLFEASIIDNTEAIKSSSVKEFETSARQPELGTPDKPCPATLTGECSNPECVSETFVCEGCGKDTPYCFGGDGDELCNNCWTSPEIEISDKTQETIQYIKKLHEEKNNFTYEFPSESHAIRFVEMCKRRNVDCSEIKLDGAAVTVVDHKEDRDLLCRLATDVENNAYPKSPLTEEPSYKSEHNGQLTLTTQDEPPEPDDFETLDAYEKAYANWAGKYPELAKAIEAREKASNDSVGQYVYEFESTYTAFDSIKVHGKVHGYFTEDNALRLSRQLENSELILECEIAKEYHGYTIEYSYRDGNHEAVKQLLTTISEQQEAEFCWLNDRVYRDANQLGVHFKLKREAKVWAEQFELKYSDCNVEIVKDKYKEFNYVLKIIKNNLDDPQWWQEVTRIDYSKSPEENLYQEKYHLLVQKDGQSETVEISYCDEANARKNYQHLVESIPDSHVHLMSNKRGCVESYKPVVQQSKMQVEPLPSDVLDDELEEPTFSFMATGMGWLNVIHNGEVLGNIYSSKIGWELETGEVFETRDEAAVALFNSLSVAA